jgi:hypothetical protein
VKLLFSSGIHYFGRKLTVMAMLFTAIVFWRNSSSNLYSETFSGTYLRPEAGDRVGDKTRSD